MLTQAPKGTKDVTPYESYKWHYVENIMRKTADAYGYREIRTPGFEHTELFLRGVGDTTDVVQKEMYTFLDKGDRSITLKPEGTAGAARAFIEHGMFNDALPLKMYYFTPVYRYEKPQSGRLREHHQFGVEAFGGSEPTLDAEIILLALSVLSSCGLKGLKLNINSIGCPECRAKYNAALKEYFKGRKLCETCQSRLDRNPMRILDCKDPDCGRDAENAPVILDYICDSCRAHFEKLKQLLDAMNVDYTVNPRIVRGLDYYTKTVFEIIAKTDDGEITVCGGGRYDGLVRQLGDKDVCGIGFGMGIERLLMLMENQNLLPDAPAPFKAYVVSGENERPLAFKFVQTLRESGISAEGDHNNKSFKAQFKYAGKLNVPYVVIIGETEAQSGKYTLKDMANGTQNEYSGEEIISILRG